MTLFTGVGAAMVTPFGKDGNIDYSVLERYIEHLLDGGTAALVPFGTTGEPATVTAAEYEQAVKFVIAKTKGRAPVIVGAGSNSTAIACEHAQKAKDLGADAVLVVTPYYNKCTQRGIVEHYKAVAKVGVPVIVYNVPTRTCVNILPKTIAELADIDGIIGIKEASGDIDQFQDAAKVCADKDFAMYCGDDSLTVISIAYDDSHGARLQGRDFGCRQSRSRDNEQALQALRRRRFQKSARASIQDRRVRAQPVLRSKSHSRQKGYAADRAQRRRASLTAYRARTRT